MATFCCLDVLRLFVVVALVEVVFLAVRIELLLLTVTLRDILVHNTVAHSLRLSQLVAVRSRNWFQNGRDVRVGAD